MDIQVLYHTKTGHSRKIAQAVAQAVGVQARDIAQWQEETGCDVLFLVGGIYGGIFTPTEAALAAGAAVGVWAMSTALIGAAYLAGLSCGVYRSTAELSRQWQAERVFAPTMSRDRAGALMDDWERAVRQATIG